MTRDDSIRLMVADDISVYVRTIQPGMSTVLLSLVHDLCGQLIAVREISVHERDKTTMDNFVDDYVDDIVDHRQNCPAAWRAEQ